MTPAGFSHSEIHESKLASSSSWLIAGTHVLHRLLMPRHPPHALCSLTSVLSRTLRSPTFCGWSEPSFLSSPRSSHGFTFHNHLSSDCDSCATLAQSPEGPFRLRRGHLFFSSLFRMRSHPENWRAKCGTTLVRVGLICELIELEAQ